MGHADELFIEFMPVALMTNKEDAAMAKKMVKLWTGFASARDHKEWGQQVGWSPMDRDERQYGMYHILDNNDLRLPDYTDPVEKKMRDRFILSVDMVNREIMPAASKRKRVVEVNKDNKKVPPHGGEL